MSSEFRGRGVIVKKLVRISAGVLKVTILTLLVAILCEMEMPHVHIQRSWIIGCMLIIALISLIIGIFLAGKFLYKDMVKYHEGGSPE